MDDEQDAEAAWMARVVVAYDSWAATLSDAEIEGLTSVLRGVPPRDGSLAGIDLTELGSSLGGAGALDGSGLDVYAGFDALPVEVALRWIALVDAAMADVHLGCTLPFPGGARWPQTLLLHAARAQSIWAGARGVSLTLTSLEALASACGWLPSAVLHTVLATPVEATDIMSWQTRVDDVLRTAPGYPEALERHVEVVRTVLRSPSAHVLAHVVRMLAPAADPALAALAPELCDVATRGQPATREAAAALLARAGSAAVLPLRDLLQQAKPAQRAHALRLLFEHADRTGDEDLREDALTRARADRAASVREVAERHGPAPDRPVLDAAVPASPAVRSWAAAVTTKVPAAADQLLAFLADRRPHPETPPPAFEAEQAWAVIHDLQTVDPTGVPVLALLKTLRFLRVPLIENERGTERVREPVLSCVDAWRAGTGRPDLLELADGLNALGEPPGAVLLTHLSWRGLAENWPPADVLPALEQSEPYLADLLRRPRQLGHDLPRYALFQAAGRLPHPSAELVDTVFELAVGAAKGDREESRKLLTGRPDVPQRLRKTLRDKRFAVREQAAEWLGRLRDAESADALTEALRSEKHDAARAAIVGALEALGRWGDSDSRHELEVKAHARTGSGLPTAAAWLDLSALPRLRWADERDDVPIAVVSFLVDQVVRTRRPTPDALVRGYVRALLPADRASFGAAILTAWIQHDLTPHSREEAERLAEQLWGDRYANWTQAWSELPREAYLAEIVGRIEGSPAGSALPAKGLLALAAACAGPGVVDLARDYVQTWYGHRAAQGKALLAMLAWTAEPSAVQFLISVRRRFRTGGFQAEAGKQVDELALRLGWSADDLADRTVPFAGLEDDGTLRLSYGSTRIVASLGPDLKLGMLRDGDGIPLTGLPGAGPGDDAESVAAAHRAFAASSKELKTLVPTQRARLVEAMCVGRNWALSDWAADLAEHPVGRRLTERLVWLLSSDHGQLLFRPVGDGRYVGADRVEVKLPSEGTVRLAHDVLVDRATATAWVAALSAAGVTPLFTQFGRTTVPKLELIDDLTSTIELPPTSVAYPTLKARASRRGWQRGDLDDGPWFDSWVRSFPSAGVTAVLTFSMISRAEEDVPVVLRSLTFRTAEGPLLALGQVPPVMLDECRRDILSIAARARS